jgi:response regulator RpfG family c-di-GMP phosphodiesterase
VSGPNPRPEFERTPATVLVVDDEEPIRNALRRFLTQEKYQVLAVGTAAEALDAVRRQPVSCALVDVRLPDLSGMDLLAQLLEADPHAVVIMVSAVNDAATAKTAIQRGAFDYLVKPMDLVDLLQAVQRGIRRRDSRIESERLAEVLRHEVSARTEELRQEREVLRTLSVTTLQALVNALEAKDSHLQGHSARVADLAGRVASACGLDEPAVAEVRTAGRLHDIGKIGIHEAILNKHGPLTDEEFAHVKTHAEIGAQILAPMTHLGPVIGYVRHHHERWDGKGYPAGLAGPEIPMGARILGAVEIFDALTTSRPYQDTMTPEQAVARMGDLVGTVLDADVHRALAAVVAAGEAGPA